MAHQSQPVRDVRCVAAAVAEWLPCSGQQGSYVARVAPDDHRRTAARTCEHVAAVLYSQFLFGHRAKACASHEHVRFVVATHALDDLHAAEPVLRAALAFWVQPNEFGDLHAAEPVLHAAEPVLRAAEPVLRAAPAFWVPLIEFGDLRAEALVSLSGSRPWARPYAFANAAPVSARHFAAAPVSIPDAVDAAQASQPFVVGLLLI